jgi:outer membrane receptor protein involved in Fe transport
LDNAKFDPCSIGPTGYVPPAPGSELFNLCVNSGTGMLPSQVGVVPDIISGQIGVFEGTNPNALPRPEEASTTTFGFVWEPEIFDFLAATTISVDYYDITIDDYIGEPTGHESLDLCYVLADPATCNGIVRVGGAFGEAGTGVPAFFMNFVAYEAEGVDLVVNTGFDAGNVGEFAVAYTAHQYLTNQFQTTAATTVVDCKGYYGLTCDPVPEFRSTLRVSWFRDNLDASLLWRRIGEMDAEPDVAPFLYSDFRSVDAQDYFDLTFGFAYRDFGRISLLVTNIMDEDPPILGNNTGTTTFNSGNTFPSLFDTMGRTYFVNLKLTF